MWSLDGASDSEPVHTFVKKLRQQFGDDVAQPAYIFNERGIGYRMAKPGGP